MTNTGGSAARFGGSYATGKDGDGECMRRIMMDHLSDKFGLTTEELSELVAHDFGSFGERMFLRSLSRLVEEGCVRKGIEYYVNNTQDATCLYFKIAGSRIREAPVDTRPIAMRVARYKPWWRWTLYLAIAIRHQPRCAVATPALPIGPWPGYRILAVGAMRRWDIAPKPDLIATKIRPRR